MSQLIESIRLLNGKFSNVPYHEERMRNSLGTLFGVKPTINLDEFLNSFNFPKKGLYKCRLLYDEGSRAVEFLPYTFKPIKSLKLIVDNNTQYHHKYSDRSHLIELMERRGDCDDILIIKNGYVTDSFYANIVFKKGANWYTPKSHLLKGTMRESLIRSGKIQEQEIKASDIKEFDKFKLINAMLGFEGQECDISNIF